MKSPSLPLDFMLGVVFPSTSFSKRLRLGLAFNGEWPPSVGGDYQPRASSRSLITGSLKGAVGWSLSFLILRVF